MVVVVFLWDPRTSVYKEKKLILRNHWYLLCCYTMQAIVQLGVRHIQSAVFWWGTATNLTEALLSCLTVIQLSGLCLLRF